MNLSNHSFLSKLTANKTCESMLTNQANRYGVKSPGSEYKRYRWVFPSGTIIDGYQSCSAVPLSIGFNPMGATSPIARRCFHRVELSGEPAKDSSLGSCQLLPPSGQARTEGCGLEPSKPFTASSRDKPSFFKFRARAPALRHCFQ